MQQDNNHMDDKLRQLENQQLPDLSNMDAHWRKMEQLLQSQAKSNTAKPVPSFSFYARKLFIAAAVILVVFAGWYLKDIFGKPEKVTAVATIKIPAQQAKENSKPSELTTAVDPKSEKQTVIARSQVPDNAKAITSPVSIAVDNDAKEAHAKEAIAFFYKNIQNPVQEYRISADDGGSINASKGSLVDIPPSAFVDENGKIISGEVNINVEEFYNYADMVAANLSTMSNGKILISGGMIRITATANGDKLNLRSNKEIAVFMPAADYDPEMKLFTTQSETGDNVESARFASFPAQERNINWELTGKQNNSIVFDGKTLMPDKLDQPYSVIKTGKKTTAKFALSKKSSLTPSQMEAILKEKFSDEYDVIKVIRDGEPRKASTFLYRGTIDMESVIGDSVKLTLQHALRGKYIERKDSSFYADKIRIDSIRFMNDFSSKQSSYSFSVKKLGWVNCDKYCNLGNRTNFVINLPPDVEADKFVSQVVFMSTRSSVVPGRANNNQIGFQNIPANMGAYIVGIGVRNGKVVSFMQKLKVDAPEVSITDLQETTPEAFRKKLAQLDMN